MIRRFSELQVSSLAKSKGYTIGPVYHGTNANFNEFSMNYFGRTDDGYYGKGALNSTKNLAQTYTIL